MALSLFGSSSSTTGGNKTYDSEYGYLHTFVDLLARIFEVIFGIFGKLGSIGGTEDAEGEGEDEVQ